MKPYYKVLCLIFMFSAPLVQAFSLTDAQKSQGDCSPNMKGVEVEGDLNLVCGYTKEEHRKLLEKEKATLRLDLKNLYQSKHKTLLLEKENLSLKKRLLEVKLSEVETQLTNIDESYQKRIEFLETTIKELRTFSGDINDKRLADAIAALKQGETEKADTLFKQVEEQEKKSIERAAQAAFARGKIAQDNIDYTKAYEHFERAVGYAPNNAEYLSRAGSMAGTVANHTKEIEWKQKALAIALKEKGEDSPQVAIGRNNLGLAWKSLGEYQKAIGYYEQALASDLKTYGEGHPQVATYRNNLGSAWQSLGEYQKAIGYFEQALKTFKRRLGENHPNTKVVQDNLEGAQDALAENKRP